MSQIALCVDLAPAQHRRLADAVGNELLVDLTGECIREDAVPESFKRCEIAFGNPPASWLVGAEGLRWVQLESVGFGEYMDLDWQQLQGRLTLTNLAGFFAEPVAETALAGLLSLSRGIDRLTMLKSKGQWEGDPIRTRLRLLHRRHVVLVGYGATNRKLADLLAPFECRIDVIRSDSPSETLDAALVTAEIVVCAAPDTVSTRQMFDARRLALLPETALFANLGRGSLVDENALVDALRQHRLAGAVLDVTQAEPLPQDHPLWDCPNTLLTQHSGGGTDDELDRKIDVFLANLDRYRRNERLQGVIDIKRGY
jgi:glyoxylate/hydroxypyruvate reductase A